MTCRTRFAPSPTGYLHIGGARTALYCWLEARRRGGEFILRIEDTDRERSTQEAVDAILEGMQWLGLEYDEGPYYQTLRMQRYRQVSDELIKAGKAYRCDCSRERLDALREAAMAAGTKPRYDGHCRARKEPIPAGAAAVVRFRNPDAGSVVFEDKVRGRIEWSNEELDDLVIWRSDDYPTYNFAVVVDDLDMGITEVIRGDDHVNNTPRQINIYHALGAPVPRFAHMPMILDPDGAKLSKRTGAADVMEYKAAGYLPHAIVNYLARLGWSHGDQEIFSLEQMKSLFAIEDVNHSPSRLDPAKLGWLNQHYLKTDAPADVARHLAPLLESAGFDITRGPAPADVVVALRERAQTLKEMVEKAAVWYLPLETCDEAAVAKHLVAAARGPLEAVRAALAALQLWTPEAVHGALQSTAETL